ncbi:MAG: putative mycofactocin radical SAM maturase MftC [Firmicutes bacterium]|nr:putative mycofactocin radical SAM maturase MftC [Bacillota bacterium]
MSSLPQIRLPELKAAFIVDFEITQRCPYRCFFCEADIPNIKPGCELNTDEIFRILQKLADAEVPNVFFTGGEPLLRPDLPDLFRHCSNLGLDPCVSTNAFSLDESNLRQLIDAGLDSMQVSIFGPKAIHEAIVGKNGSYAEVMSNLKMLVDAGVRVEIACVGLRENLEYIPTLVREVALLGVPFFRVLRYVPGHRKEMLEHIPRRRSLQKCIVEIQRAAKEYDIDIALGLCPGTGGATTHLVRGIHPVAFACPAGKTSFAIMPNGDVYPCIFFKNRPEMLCGNVLRDSVSEIWNNPKMVVFRRLTPADYTGICGHCERKWLCYSARCVAYNLGNDLYGDDLSCYIVRETLGLEV